MVFKLCVVFYSKTGGMVTLANVIAEGAKKVCLAVCAQGASLCMLPALVQRCPASHAVCAS